MAKPLLSLMSCQLWVLGHGQICLGTASCSGDTCRIANSTRQSITLAEISNSTRKLNSWIAFRINIVHLCWDTYRKRNWKRPAGERIKFENLIFEHTQHPWGPCAPTWLSTSNAALVLSIFFYVFSCCRNMLKDVEPSQKLDVRQGFSITSWPRPALWRQGQRAASEAIGRSGRGTKNERRMKRKPRETAKILGKAWEIFLSETSWYLVIFRVFMSQCRPREAWKILRIVVPCNSASWLLGSQ